MEVAWSSFSSDVKEHEEGKVTVAVELEDDETDLEGTGEPFWSSWMCLQSICVLLSTLFCALFCNFRIHTKCGKVVDNISGAGSIFESFKNCIYIECCFSLSSVISH